MTTENDGCFGPRVKVLIILEVDRIFWYFFGELIDATKFCLFFKLIPVGWSNI